jgi:hypothetical protein
MSTLTLLPLIILAGIAAALLERSRLAKRSLCQPVPIENDAVEPTPKRDD